MFGPGVDISAMSGRLQMFMEQEGLPFDISQEMIFNSRLAQELAKWGEGTAQSEQLNMALYQAFFVDGQNIGDVDVLLGLVEALGLPVEEAREVLEQRTMKTSVDNDWQHAMSIGVRSVPTFAVGLSGVAGAQPYEELARLLEHAGASLRTP